MDQPKVRFSQALDSLAARTGDDDAVPNKSKGKVKIKSIVPTAFPVKILKNGQRVLIKNPKSNLEINKKQRSSSNTSGCSKFTSSTSSIPTTYVSEINDSPSRNEYENVNNPNVALNKQNTKNTDDNLEECIDKMQHLTFENSGNTKNCAQQTGTIREQDQECESVRNSKNDSFKSCLDLDDDSDIEIIQIIEKPVPLKSTKTNKSCTDNRKKNSQKENKENKTKSNSSNIQQSSNKTKILKDTTNPPSDKNKNVPSKKFAKSQNKIQLMPCAKFREANLSKNKSTGKVKKADTRKSMVYHVANSHNNISVERGTFHKKCSHPADYEVEESDEKNNIASEDLLSRPEYNSTVCVIKNLKKLENEKLITDIQHLPQEYKNLIYGKVSAGLDVGPYECIFKDLINISVDDNQFPARLMRSKDPEPRDKDIVPQISDFYQPKYAEQYFTIANPVVPRPVNLSTLSAFTISNKICAWKNARDNF